jgi:ketosteroid isomerase-like protein
MKFIKQIFIAFFVILFVASFSAYGGNVNHITVSPGIELKDTLATKILSAFNQIQTNDGSCTGGIITKNTILKYEGTPNTIPFAGTYIGKAGIVKFWLLFFNSVNCPKAELRYYLRQGNIVHLHWTEEGIIRSTGKRYIMETVQRWEFNDRGELVRLRWYNDSYALYQAFQLNTNPQLSLAQHTADYNITGNGPVDALPIVQNYYAQFAQGNLAAILNGVTPNFALILAGPEGLTKIAGTWIGPEGMAQFFNALFTAETYNSFFPVSFTTDGSRVDVEFQEQIVVLETGKIVDCAGLHSFVITSSGRLAKLRSYNDTYIVAWGYSN